MRGGGGIPEWRERGVEGTFEGWEWGKMWRQDCPARAGQTFLNRFT